MKKLILMAVLAALVVPSQRAYADESVKAVEFTYCSGDPRDAEGRSESCYRGGAMLLTDEIVSRFDGCRITEVSIVNGEFHGQDSAPIQIFCTNSLGEKPFYTIAGNMDVSRPKEYKSYPLSQPVEIRKGAPFFVGFTVWTSGTTAPDYEVSYPIWTDGVYHTDFPGGYFAFSFTAGEPEKMEWVDGGYSGGQICIKLKIEGDKLPKNVAEIFFVRVNDVIDPNSQTLADLSVRNLGVNPITDLDISYSILGEPQTVHWDYSDYPIAYNSEAGAVVKVSFNEEGANLPLKFYISKINGVEPSIAGKSYEVIVHSIQQDHGFDRKMVVEEASGSGCGWCVRGIVGLDNMFKQHSDGTFIPISSHHAGYGEETAPFGYEVFWEKYITHNPSCLINRNIPRYGIFDPNFYSLSNTYEEVMKTRAIADIHIKHCGESNGYLDVFSDVTFAFPEEFGDYSVAYIVTEDNVGPYYQANSYSGMDVDMDGWEDLPETVETYYDFLNRGISSFYGTPLNVEGAIEPGKIYEHYDRVNLVKVRNRDLLAVVGMVINNKTGCIENAVRIPVEFSAVEKIAADEYPVEYYDLSGRRLSEPPTTGIYIHRQGGEAKKVIRM